MPVAKTVFSPEKRPDRKRMAEHFNKTYDSAYKASYVRLVEYNEDRMIFLVSYREYDPITNTGTMQLVKRTKHEATYPHFRGVSKYVRATGVPYDLPDWIRAGIRSGGNTHTRRVGVIDAIYQFR